jgi:hypothetical protein
MPTNSKIQQIDWHSSMEERKTPVTQQARMQLQEVSLPAQSAWLPPIYAIGA